MLTLALLLTGYSLCCALALAVTHVLGEAYREQPVSRMAGLALLAALSTLQWAHLGTLLPTPLVPLVPQVPPSGLAYRLALFAVAPSFYLLVRPLLQPAAPPPAGWRWGAHALPWLLCPLLPAPWAQPVAFVLGSTYLLWVGRRLWALRSERARFAFEMGLLGLAVALALGVAALALWPGLLPAGQFVPLYASAVGLALLLVQITLGLRPHLPAAVQEAAREATQTLATIAPPAGADPAPASPSSYSQTTLAKVDCDAALARLAQLMGAERLYTDPDLSLAGLAQRLGLTGHQLSELLNTRLGKSFARYTREQRVDAARTMLLAEPGASVLSVGLSVGFAAQSNFYDAFREIEGMTPGQYRKLHRSPPASAS